MARSTFKFRLKRLLDVRLMREQQEQQKLITFRQKVVEEQQRLVQMQQVEQRLRTEQNQPLQRGDDIHEFVNKRAWYEKEIKENMQQQQAQQGNIQQAEQAVLVQQQVVKQAGIDVKALEKVEDKQREEHRIDQLREEGLFMDDLAGQGFLRRKKQEEEVS